MAGGGPLEIVEPAVRVGAVAEFGAIPAVEFAGTEDVEVFGKAP